MLLGLAMEMSLAVLLKHIAYSLPTVRRKWSYLD